MLTLQTLRQARAIARWVLVWFVLSVGVAVAAPVVQPQSATLVCSASGMVKLVVDDDGIAPHHGLDCVLCLALASPPPADMDVASALPLLGHVFADAFATPSGWRTAAPLPARGPPQI